MFKIGDKVECTRTQVAGEYVVNPGYIGYISHMDAVSLAVDGKLCAGYPVMSHEAFKLAEREPQFDLKKNPWFIRTGTKEKSEACQKWLFEQGVGWVYFGKQVNQYGENSLTNVRDDGEVVGCFMHAQKPHESAQEIILEFSTIVKFGTFPIVESEQDKKIKELQQTIEKAQKQIEELKNMNS